MIDTIAQETLQLWTTKRKTRRSASGWISGNAVCCQHNGETPDKRGRGGLITGTDGTVSYSCFNCHFKASFKPGYHINYKFRKLLKWLGADDNQIKRLTIDALRIKDLVVPDLEPEEKVEISFTKRPLPPEALSFEQIGTFYQLEHNDDDPSQHSMPDELLEAVSYIYERGLLRSPETLKRNTDFYWSSSTDNNYNKRVIIPFTWKNEIVGFTARTFDDKVKPKYFTSIDPNYVFNIDKQGKDWKFVIVCEGPFDALSIDGVAVLHNVVSETQADIIDSLGREVIVVPDWDSSGRLLIEAAIEYGWNVSFPVWRKDCKDINEAVVKYGKLFVMKSIIEGKVTNSLRIKLMERGLEE